ncbi:hypothetical protein FB45DRAFT_1067291 [Roridomyces roridus]|uniref:Uncharacterized protein n=1 Tax=Roridomyces roridus TaxID=1738132 RepID=A0AAD7B3P2_9AGAR|nr:hypothetical protein FB45DRAFT_1067291 [Roridomyces roridus]
MPTLPSELEREIFEIAFRSSYQYGGYDENLRRKLGKVATHVQYWISLIRYEAIDLMLANDLAHYLPLLKRIEPPGLFSIAVKHICIGPSCLVHIGSTCPNKPWPRVDPIPALVCILSTCTAVEQFGYYLQTGLTLRDHDVSQLLPLIRQLPLKRLGTRYAQFMQVAEIRVAEPPLFPNLTHLSISFYNYEEIEASASSLTRTVSQFPRLTHFGFHSYKERPSDALLKQFCLAFPSLDAILISWKGSQLKPRDDYCFDERIVQVCLDEKSERSQSEENEYVWRRADNILAERKQAAQVAVETPL